jgi:hypothetical protein
MSQAKSAILGPRVRALRGPWTSLVPGLHVVTSALDVSPMRGWPGLSPRLSGLNLCDRFELMSLIETHPEISPWPDLIRPPTSDEQ